MNSEEMKKKLVTRKLQGMSAVSLYSLINYSMKQGPVLIIDPKSNISFKA